MSLQEKIERVQNRRRFGMRPGLDRIEALLAALDNPERGLACIHVAGTNGKGSVAAMAASVLQRAGLGAIGLYTSPHLVYFNERIRIDGEPVGDAALERALDAALAAAERCAASSSPGGDATFFELATAAAFFAFREAGVRVAVVEAGLGGRLDATNVVVPVVSVIVGIGLEHCEWLGDTIAKIAAEKAGIVKPGRPVVVGAMPGEALAVIARRAAESGSPLIQADAAISSRRAKDGSVRIAIEDGIRSLTGIRFPLEADYQRGNLATAVAALEAFSQVSGIPIEDDAFRAGLESVVWPCRYQTVREAPRTIVDGAHNPPAAEAFASSLAKRETAPLALVAGFCADKDALAFLRILKPRFRVAFATETPNERTMPAAEAAALMSQAGIPVVAAESDWRDALAKATAWAEENGGAVVVCGSLFLAGAVANHFGALPWRDGIKAANEKLANC